MKILIIIDDLRSGGTENVLASRLHELPNDTEINILTLFALGPIAEKISSSGVEVDFLDMKHFGLFKTFDTVRKIVEKENFEIAICMRDISRAIFPKFLKKYIPVVTMLWDSPVIKRSFRQSWLEWYQVRFANAVPYCSSKNTALALKKVYGLEGVKVIPNCYDQKRFSERKNTVQNSEREFRIVTVGGVRKEKNYTDKLEIVEKLKENDFKFKLTIIGEDPDGVIRRDIMEHRLEEEVELLGDRKDVSDLLKTADMFLFTSSSEGFPVSLLEAMATGLPCVSYEFPSLKEIDEDFSKIDVVPQGGIDDAVEKIQYLAKHPDDAYALGRNAAKHISANFAAINNAKTWLQFLKSLLPESK